MTYQASARHSIVVPPELMKLVPFPYCEYEFPMDPGEAHRHLGRLVKYCSALASVAQAVLRPPCEYFDLDEEPAVLLEMIVHLSASAVELHKLLPELEGPAHE